MLEVVLLPLLAFGLLSIAPMMMPLNEADEEEEDPTLVPMDPAGPIEPVDAVDPVDPIDPIDPVDASEPLEPTDPIEPVEPVDPSTLGATFERSEDGVDIQFGENETGRLAVFTHVYETSFFGLQGHSANYYLVPEGVEWPENTSETREFVPEGPNGEYSSNMADFAENFGLELLGSIDLLAEGNDQPTSRDMASALPPLTTNADTEYYYLDDNFSDIFTFLTEGWLVTSNGVTQTPLNTDTVGTDGSDWFTTRTLGLSIEGGGGDDTLALLDTDLRSEPTERTSLFGGAGDDTLSSGSFFAAAELYGGTGDDDLSMGDGVAYGGAGQDEFYSNFDGGGFYGGSGDDEFSLFSKEDASVYGDDGADDIEIYLSENLSIYGGLGDDEVSFRHSSNNTVYGGEGDDSLSTGAFGAVYGGDGDDRIFGGDGSTVFGGSGDDEIDMYKNPEAFYGLTSAIGGDGSDTFNIRLTSQTASSFGPPELPLPDDQIFVRIEDFDAADDVLVVTNPTSGTTVETIEIEQDADGAYTDVVLTFGGEVPPMKVRLDGLVDIQADQVIVA